MSMRGERQERGEGGEEHDPHPHGHGPLFVSLFLPRTFLLIPLLCVTSNVSSHASLTSIRHIIIYLSFMCLCFIEERVAAFSL